MLQIHSQKNQEPENDNHEALSLCDLPTNLPDDPKQNHSEPLFYTEQEHDFAFGSNQPKNKICTADELFLRGQILPLRHSVTLPSRLTTQTEEFTRSISVSISEPMSAASSRSSSTRSNASVSECNRNRFHSYPSPTPRILTRSLSVRQTNTSPSKWRLLQLGPMKVQEIGLVDPRNRKGNKMQNKDGKKKQILSLTGCKCTADVVESTVSASRNPTGFRVSKDTDVGRTSHRTSEWG